MIDLAPIIDRLSASGLFAQVGGAADYAAAASGLATGDGPFCFIVPMEVSASPPDYSGGPQVVSDTFGILMMIRPRGDAQGRMVMDVRPLSAGVSANLLGWSPAPGIDPIFMRSGGLHDFSANGLWWLDTFTCKTTIWGIP